MSDYQTEEQQVEALKQWWKEYGLSIILGIIIAIVVIFGWQLYKRHKTKVGQEASVIYARMSIDVLNNQQQDAINQAKILLRNFAATPYADLAALTLAKYEVLANKLDEAVKQLQWVVKHAHSDALQQIAKMRLARIYILQDKLQQALDLLSNLKNSVFAGLAAEIQGDAYIKLGKVDKARAMYQLALKQIPVAEQNRPILQMKLDNL